MLKTFNLSASKGYKVVKASNSQGMMGENQQLSISEDIQELFSSGTVILFTCAATGEFPLLSITENAEGILGFEPSYFLEHKNGWFDRIHPEDKERVFQQFREVIEEGAGAINEYRFKTKDGSYIWLHDEIKLIKNRDVGDSFIYGYSIDITNRKKAEIALKESKAEELKQEIERRKEAENRLHKRLSYEKAISKCSSLLLESTSSEALRKSLDVLREATHSDRVYLYKNQEENGHLYLDLVQEVTAEGVDPVGTDVRLEYSDIPWWHQKLSSQEIIHTQIDDLPEPERGLLEKNQIKSVLVIPIKVNSEWYGYVGFADTQKKRKWHEDEISLLKTVAGLLGTFEKRKNVEKSLVRQRNYTETILESLPSIYILMDENLQFLQWNNNAERYTGYSAEEMETKSAFDLIAPSDHENLKEATERVREERGEGSELNLLTKSGEKVPYFWRGYYIDLDDKKYFLCVGVDITLQKKTEKELLNEKRFNEALLESLPGIFYMFDKEGNYQRWNQNLLDSMGYTAEDMENITPSVFFDNEEFLPVQKEIQKVFEVGESEIEANLVTKEGEKIPYFLTGKLFDVDGESYLIGVGHDISAQVKAREKVRKSRELFRNLFLKAPAAIVMVGPDNRVQNVNNSFENLFGYSEEEIKGKDIDEVIVPEDDRGKVPRMPVENFSTDSFHREAQRLTKDGELVDVFVAAIPVYIDDEPIAGFGMYIDITEQKRYEEQIYNSLKEKHVLLQEIHHRVKNNLAVVSGLLQLQMYETDDPVIQETLKESENRIQTMALIHEKLYNSENLSRISCRSYIGDLVETIRNTIRTQKDITVKTDIADVKLNINKAVPFALLVNEVVTNSFKHAFKDRKEGVVTIQLQKQEDQLLAQIRDNGSGLPDDLSPHESESLGMNLINSFAQQLEAEMEMGSDGGTYIELKFEADDTNGSSTNMLDF